MGVQVPPGHFMITKEERELMQDLNKKYSKMKDYVTRHYPKAVRRPATAEEQEKYQALKKEVIEAWDRLNAYYGEHYEH